MSDYDQAFGRLMLSEAKKVLREDVGPERAKLLLERHMDVVGDHGLGQYFIHWVKYPGLYDKDLHYGYDGYKKCDNINVARAEAIHFLLEHLRENSPRGACLECGKELPWNYLTRDTIRCPWCGAIEHDFKEID